MHEWKVGDLGVARDAEAGDPLSPPIFHPGTVVRCARKTAPHVAYWRIVFGPEPAVSTIWSDHDGGSWLENTKFIDPLPEGDE